MHINAATRLVALDNNVPGTPGTTIAPAQSYRPDNEADLHNRQGDMHNDSQSELKHESVKPKTNAALRLTAEDLNGGNTEHQEWPLERIDEGPQSGVSVTNADADLDRLAAPGKTGGFDSNPMWNKATQPLGPMA